MVIGNVCSWAKPIYVSSQDVLTDRTARQILAYNETGARICHWLPASASSSAASPPR